LALTPITLKSPFFKFFLFIIFFSLPGCAATLRNSPNNTTNDKKSVNSDVSRQGAPNSLRQNIRVLISEELKEFSVKLEIDSYMMYDGTEVKLDGGELLTIRSQGGKVAVSVGETVHNSSIIKLRPVNNDEYLYFKKKSFRGEIWFSALNSKTMVVNYLDLEDYVLGVVPLEIGLKNEYFFQALKCAAVTARTFAINRLLEKRAFYDVTDGVKDQAYGGIDVETAVLFLRQKG
jgi:hypothetical protein